MYSPINKTIAKFFVRARTKLGATEIAYGIHGNLFVSTKASKIRFCVEVIMLCIVKTVHKEMVKLGATESARGMIGTLHVNIQSILQWLIEDSTKLKHVKNVQ